jgi:hypothetical protein
VAGTAYGGQFVIQKYWPTMQGGRNIIPDVYRRLAKTRTGCDAKCLSAMCGQGGIRRKACSLCHALDQVLMGPGFTEPAKNAVHLLLGQYALRDNAWKYKRA